MVRSSERLGGRGKFFLFGFRPDGYWWWFTLMHDDATLLRRYAEFRSEEAFAELVRRHLNLVYFAALRSAGGNGPLAEDVAQEVFTALARQAAELARHATLVGWLYTTTRFTTAKAVRTEGRRKRREREAHIMMERAGENDSAAEWERLRPLLDDALEELSGRDREAVLLRCLEGRAFAEIGATLRVSEDAARMRVERALEKLRGVLARRGVTSTGAALGVTLANHAVGAAPVGLAGSVTSGALAVGEGAAGVFFGFMSTTKLGVAGAVVLLVLVGLGTYERQRRAVIEREVAELRGEREVRMATQRAKENRARDTEREEARVRAEIDATRVKLAEAAKAPPPAPAWDPTEEGRAYLVRNPEVNRAFGAYVSASLRFQYAPMYRALGWSEEQIRRFEAFRGQGMGMAAYSEDGRSISMPFGAKIDRSDYGSRFTEAVGGPEGAQKFYEFQSLGTARRLTRDVASALYSTDSPLSPTQADQVVQIFVESRNVGPAARNGEFDWDAVLAKSQTVLSAEQLAVIAGKRSGELFRLALNRAVNEPTTNAAAPEKTTGR